MDENQNYQNWQNGQNPEGGAVSGPAADGNAYQGNSYQDNQYQNNSYQDNQYQNNPYQNASYQNPYGQPNGSYQNYQNYQTPYAAPPQLDLEEPMKMGEWLITMLIMMVPCVNIVMMFVWAFSRNEKKSKSNFFKAFLIMFAVMFVLYLILIFAFVALGISLYY